MDQSDLLKPLLAAITTLVPTPVQIDWTESLAARWSRPQTWLPGSLQSFHADLGLTFADLFGIERQEALFRANLEQFLSGQPANAVLLWGARGTGKSSMVHAALAAYHAHGLRIIEVDKGHLVDLPSIVQAIKHLPYRFVVFCDDLGFAEGERASSALKSVLDGTLENLTENVLVICTSNRRHLVPEPASDNLSSAIIDGELHHGDAVEERIALSDRFGLWLSFPSYPQETYLTMCRHWYSVLSAGRALPHFGDTQAVAANRFAIGRGGRSGRVAKQFVIDWIAREEAGLNN